MGSRFKEVLVNRDVIFDKKSMLKDVEQASEKTDNKYVDRHSVHVEDYDSQQDIGMNTYALSQPGDANTDEKIDRGVMRTRTAIF